jgi:hypothetical protein
MVFGAGTASRARLWVRNDSHRGGSLLAPALYVLAVELGPLSPLHSLSRLSMLVSGPLQPHCGPHTVNLHYCSISKGPTVDIARMSGAKNK